MVEPLVGRHGLLLAATYVTGTLTLLATRARGVLVAVLAPLGRIALTSYLTATPLMILAGHTLDLPHTGAYTGMLLCALGLLVLQCAGSTLWLRHHAQGPLEWLLRRGTWWGAATTSESTAVPVTMPART